jgi:hypothetical protein
MHEIDKMHKIENIKVKSHTIHKIKKNIFSRKPLREKTQLEGESALISFLWYENNANTREKALSMELLETCDLLGCYKTLTPYFILSNFPLPIVLVFYGTKYNNIEWNPFFS